VIGAAKLDTPRATLAITFAVYALLVLVKLGVHHFDASYFVMAGIPACDPALTPPGLTCPTKDHGGYDGQFYYRLAVDPFTDKPFDHGIGFDMPAHRQQRIVYPLLAWSLTRGHVERLPWVLLAINFAGMMALGALAGHAARALGRHALLGLVVPLYPGYVFTLARDLSEILAGCFMIGALLAARRGARWAVALLATLAMLSRETTLVVPAAMLVCAVLALRHDRSRARVADAIAYAVPIVVYVAWQSVLARHWGISPSQQNSKSLSLPLVGLARFVADAALHLYVLDAIHVVLILAFGVLVARRLRGSTAMPHEKLAWVGYALLLTLLGREAFWDDMCHYTRALAEYFVLGAFVLFSARREGERAPRFEVPVLVVWGVATAFHLFASSDIVANVY
jgi:hypothetical protein